MLIADHRGRALDIRRVGIHHVTHVFTIKSEFSARFVNLEQSFRSMRIYVQPYTQIYSWMMNETQCLEREQT